MMVKLRAASSEAVRLVRLLGWVLKLLWASHKPSTLLVSCLTVVQAVTPIAQLWVTKLLVDQMLVVLAADESSQPAAIDYALWLLLLEVVVLLLGLLVGILRAFAHSVLQENLVYHVQMRVVEKSAEIDLADYESPTFYDQLHRAQQNAMYTPVQLLEASLELTQATLTLITAVTIITLYNPWVVLLLLIPTIPGFFINLYYGRQRFILFDGRTPDGRRAEYLSDVVSQDVYAKEVRVWGIGAYIIEQIDRFRSRFKRENINLSKKQTIGALFGEALTALGYYGAYLTVILGVIARTLTLGDMTLYAGIFSRVQSLFDDIMNAAAQMYELQLFAQQLDTYLNLEPTIVTPNNPQPLPSMQQGLSIENLSFVYPNTEKVVFDGLSFAIEPGECVALVGANGAGKTSLVKCLLRLYEPTGGDILVDDVSIDKLDLAQWRASVGVVFQDYVRYQLTVSENIGVGQIGQIDDLAAIQLAAEQAGIADMLAQLPDGYATQLGRQFENGVELSLGQWQRLAIARALLRDAPLLILDEPTAAMDAQAEYDLYRYFQELARERMTLLISHRFSTVRMADRILVMEQGKIIEEGTHEQLLAANGRYAYLFNLQAESYQATPAPTAVNGVHADVEHVLEVG